MSQPGRSFPSPKTFLFPFPILLFLKLQVSIAEGLGHSSVSARVPERTLKYSVPLIQRSLSSAQAR